MSLDDLRSILERSPFVQQYGFHLESAESGMATLYFAGKSDLLRPDGILSGPVFMAAADVAMWMAIMSALGLEAASTVTVEMKTNFLAALEGAQDFRCTATLLKTGSRLVYGVADCRDLNGRLLTHHTMTYMRRGRF